MTFSKFPLDKGSVHLVAGHAQQAVHTQAEHEMYTSSAVFNILLCCVAGDLNCVILRWFYAAAAPKHCLSLSTFSLPVELGFLLLEVTFSLVFPFAEKSGSVRNRL
jgi:hypothetical protein